MLTHRSPQKNWTIILFSKVTHKFLPNGVKKYDIKLSGKWMMFYPWAIMDEKWEEAVGQYRSGKLTGK